ncbi:hypothetical protein [Streptomyces sp. NPDC058249]
MPPLVNSYENGWQCVPMSRLPRESFAEERPRVPEACPRIPEA